MGFRLQGVAGEAQVQLNLLGRHNVANALAAAAAAHALGVPLDGIVAGLQALQPVRGPRGSATDRQRAACDRRQLQRQPRVNAGGD